MIIEVMNKQLIRNCGGGLHCDLREWRSCCAAIRCTDWVFFISKWFINEHV